MSQYGNSEQLAGMRYLLFESNILNLIANFSEDMITIYDGKKLATMGLKKQHWQNKELGDIWKW